MKGSQLLEALEKPRRVTPTREVWEVAAILAGLRVRTNDPIRAVDRNRGAAKNWLADIWGVFGELIALRMINAIADLPVEHHPIDFERSVDDVDLTVHLADGPLRLETKAHLLEPGKRWFMVNQRAHERSVRRGAVGYLPIMSVLGGRTVVVGALLTTAELSQWTAPTVTLRDPAIGVPLGDLAITHFHAALPDLTRTLQEGGPLIDARQLATIASLAGDDLESWQRELPPLERLTAAQLRDTFLGVREQIERSNRR